MRVVCRGKWYANHQVYLSKRQRMMHKEDYTLQCKYALAILVKV